MHLNKTILTALLATLPLSALANVHPLTVALGTSAQIANHEYYLDVDNCFAPPLTHNCNSTHDHHFELIKKLASVFTIPRDERIPAGHVMYSVVGIRHPYDADKPKICTDYAGNTNKAFVPTRVQTVRLKIYKTMAGLGPEKCQIIY